MGFLGSFVASMSLFFFGDLLASLSTTPTIQTLPNCNFDTSNYTYLQTTYPLSVLPPKPTLPNSAELYDSTSRNESYNPATYYTFQTILKPLNTLNTLLSINDIQCNQYKQNILSIWATRKAITGVVNPYSTLLHKQTSATIALEYMAMSMNNRVVYTWLSQLKAQIVRYPSPYDNNFKIFEYRALVLLNYATFQNIKTFGPVIDSFVKQRISNGIITTEIRNQLTIKYHSYYLNYLFDTYYILRYGSGYKSSIRREIESVLTTMQLGPSAFSNYSINIISEELNIINVLLDKWQCVQYNNKCLIYTGLWRKLSRRRKI